MGSEASKQTPKHKTPSRSPSSPAPSPSPSSPAPPPSPSPSSPQVSESSSPSLRPFDIEMGKLREEVLGGESNLSGLSQKIEEFHQGDKNFDKGRALYMECLKLEELFTQVQLSLDKLEIPTIGGRKGPGSFQCPKCSL